MNKSTSLQLYFLHFEYEYINEKSLLKIHLEVTGTIYGTEGTSIPQPAHAFKIS